MLSYWSLQEQFLHYFCIFICSDCGVFFWILIVCDASGKSLARHGFAWQRKEHYVGTFMARYTCKVQLMLPISFLIGSSFCSRVYSQLPTGSKLLRSISIKCKIDKMQSEFFLYFAPPIWDFPPVGPAWTQLLISTRGALYSNQTHHHRYQNFTSSHCTLIWVPYSS